MSAGAPAGGKRLGDYSTDRRVWILSAMSLAVGAIAAGVAWVLVWLIAVITNLAYFHRYSSVFVSPSSGPLAASSIFIPVIGGLIIGLMARFGSDRIRGHGIPEALEAILIGRSRLDARVAILKPVSSAVSIGTGGPFGAEGPIIMTGGAFGSLFAQLFHLSSAERKTLLVAGAAAGMSAIFASPVAATLLAVELLLFEWKPRSFIPVALAAAAASVARVPLLGAGPVFPVAPHGLQPGWILLAACGLGLAAGLASSLLTAMVYGAEDLFAKVPIHWMWWPAIGGLGVGIGGLINPRVLGVGYESIHGLLAGTFSPGAAAGLATAKAAVWSFALGSGTSGGVLAPLLMMGGALGTVFSALLHGDAGLWATVGMAALMGGTMRSPLTAMVFTCELTRDWNLLPTLLVACACAHAVTVLLMRRSILTEKVARRGHHVFREYSVDPFDVHRVGEVMDRTVATIDTATSIRELSERLRREPELARRQGTPILDSGGKLVGIITRSDLMRALERDAAGETAVLDAGTRKLLVAHEDELIRDAVERMLENDIGRLPVVDRTDPTNLVGYLGRSGILSARHRLMKEENLRERGAHSSEPDILP